MGVANLTETETEEIRYRTETRTDTWTDEDGNTHTDTYEVEVPYTYYIMTVTLKNNGILRVEESTLDAEQLEMYHTYRDTSGNMPLLFGGGSFDTSPSTDLSGVEFVNGTRPGNEAIIELAKAQEGNVGGQPYWSWYGFNSRVEWIQRAAVCRLCLPGCSLVQGTWTVGCRKLYGCCPRGCDLF